MATLNLAQNLGRNIATVGRLFNLPEMNISEKLSGSSSQNQPYYNFGASSNTQSPSAVLGSQAPPVYDPQSSKATATDLSGKGIILPKASPNVITTNSGSGGPQQTSGQQNYSNALNAGLSQDQNNIEAEYQQEIARLGGLENTTRSNYQGAIDQAAQYYPQFQELLTKEKGNDIGSVDARENQVKQESQSALSRTRALLADLQRRQGAQLSATGNYSSSASDAMGESFGKQAFGALSDVQKQRDQALAQVAIQRQSVENFYSRKAVETKQSYDQQMMSLQQQLNAQLDQINNAKGAAESAKRAASVDAWRNFTNNKLQLDQYMMQYQDSLDQWKQQMDTQLQDAVGYESDLSGVGNIIPSLPTQQQASTTDNAGSAITYAKSIKGNTLEDYLAQQQQQYTG